jgi:hypothetical protein
MAGVIVLAFVIACLLHQTKYDAFTTAVTAGAIFGVLWDKYLWAWKPFCYLDPKPDLRGTWKGLLHSSYVNPEMGEQRRDIESYLIVRQTYSKIDVRYFSSESGSVSVAANLFADNEGLFTLACTYRNTPRLPIRERSPIGHGGLLLYVRGNPVHKLEGEYFTERLTKGEMEFATRSEKEAHDFEQAQGFRYKKLGVIVQN